MAKVNLRNPKNSPQQIVLDRLIPLIALRVGARKDGIGPFRRTYDTLQPVPSCLIRRGAAGDRRSIPQGDIERHAIGDAKGAADSVRS